MLGRSRQLMGTKAKQCEVAALLHTRICSHLHVRMPTVVRTPNVAAAESHRLKDAPFWSTRVSFGHAAVSRSAGREVVSYCTCRVQVIEWWLFQEIPSWAFYTFDSFRRAGLGTLEISWLQLQNINSLHDACDLRTTCPEAGSIMLVRTSIKQTEDHPLMKTGDPRDLHHHQTHPVVQITDPRAHH